MAEQQPRDHAPRAAQVEINGLTFSGRFDSGNLKDVTVNEDGEFEIWNLADCEGTVHSTTYRTWFHFSVYGPRIRPGGLLTFNVVNMNKQTGLYSKGYRPVSFSFVQAHCALEQVYTDLRTRPRLARSPAPHPCPQTAHAHISGLSLLSIVAKLEEDKYVDVAFVPSFGRL